MTLPVATRSSHAAYIHGTAPEEQERLVLLNRLSNRPFLEWLGLREDERGLEVGSGLGLLCAQAAALVPRGGVVGIELSAEQLARSPRTGDRPRNLAFVRGDALRLPFRDGAASGGFDRAWCRYLLEHVAEPAHVLREIRRVLRPGGRVHVQENDTTLVRFDPPCPAFDRAWERFAALQARLGGDARIGTRLYRLLHEAGFVGIELSLAPEAHWAGSPGFAGWVENLAGNVRSAAAALVRERLAAPGEIDAALAELRALRSRPDASALFAWNRATGRRP